MIFQEQERVRVKKTGDTGIVVGTAQSIGLMYVVRMDSSNKCTVLNSNDIEKVKENNNG